MNRFDGFKRWAWSILVVSMLAFAFAGCEGDTGPQGPQGPAGADGADGADGQDGAGVDPDDPETAIALAKVEGCATCHGGVGTGHQDVYRDYTDASALALSVDALTSTDNGDGTFTLDLEFSITDGGLPFVDAAGLPSLDQKRIYIVQYDSTAGQYLNGNIRFDTNLVVAGVNPGEYTVTMADAPFAPDAPVAPFDGGHVYAYIARGSLFEHEGGSGAEIPEGSHVHLYEDVANAALAFGTAVDTDASAYASLANVSGCEKCHGTPYLKHGYRAAEVAGVPDFAACKSCHYDDRSGGHEDWQYMVDDPLNWATGGLDDATVEARYAYTANVMNDTHMSHAMEFPYPQSMQNCNTCHEGKLTDVLADTNFTGETCLSCHPLEGTNARPGDDYEQPHRAPALDYLWTRGADLSFHDITSNCQGCHGAGVSQSLTAYHTGYDVNITNAAGERYADLYTVAVDAISYDSVSGLITVEFSASDPAVVPELYISFYGWDSKHFIAAGHERDSNPACSGFRPGCQMEYVPESSGGGANPIFTEDPASVPGDWMVTADPSLWQLTKTDDIPTMIADGVIKRIEVIIAPELNLSDLAAPGPDLDVVLTAANETFDLVAGIVDDDYFKGRNASVSTAKCNVCHDALASSFHSESGRAGDGIEVCKNCHNPTYGGSHLELASRSIDSYVHAIHSFQDFDVGDTFETFDPVFAKRYDQHIHHVFPNFTIRNCEACHVTSGADDGAGGEFPVVYNVPDQSQSMPGLLSASDAPLTWYDIVGGLAVEDAAGRNIGTVPSYVTGPASRACGGCHRARLVRDDAAGDVTAFNAHTETGGTLVENSAPDDEILYGIIEKIMSMFE